MSDTIAAVSTGGVISAIGIIRLSGDEAIDIVSRVFTPERGELVDAADRQLVLGRLHDREGQVIDRCLCTVSRAPNSYTGENTAELQCHGSPVVLREGLEALYANGARSAQRGEFTKRAFLNGCMDLTGAEAVIDLIEAESAEAARNAAGQLGGAVLRRADAVYDALRDLCSHYHAEIDYPDDEIEAFRLAAYAAELHGSQETLKALLSSFQRGKLLREGALAAIIGRPNAGKSSLLNALLGYDRAIVTPVPGTTRDSIEEKLRLGSVVLRLTDTAGLRESGDPVEAAGVKRALSIAGGAELILAVFDGSREFSDEDAAVRARAITAKRAVAVVTKSDLPQRLDIDELSEFPSVCRVSSLTGEGLEKLSDTVSALFPSGEGVPVGEILTNARQAEATARALESVSAAIAAMETGLTPDAVLTEAEEAMAAIGELTGRTVREDVTDRIFQRFCVGK